MGGIEYSSRYNIQYEIREMENFVKELIECDLTNLVTNIFYDSNASVCMIDTEVNDHPELWRIAKKHLSQFELDGIYTHGEPLWDLIEINEDKCFKDQLEDPKEKRIRLGKIGEEALANWFSQNNLSYLSICQNPDTFAKLFTGTVKRPDFFLLFDSLGLIAVDAKNIKPYKNTYFSLPLEDELQRAITFERIFRMPLWYAIYATDHWYWISALKAIQVGKKMQNRSTKQVFLSICKNNFVQIVDGADLSKLYGQRMSAYDNVGHCSSE